MAKPAAGWLHQSFIFYRREDVETAPGVPVGIWVEMFRMRANLAFRDGNEAVIAAKLTGKQPAFLIVRRCKQMEYIATEWCCADARTSNYDEENDRFTGDVYNIRSIVPDTQNRQFMRLILERGAAAG